MSSLNKNCLDEKSRIKDCFETRCELNSFSKTYWQILFVYKIKRVHDGPNNIGLSHQNRWFSMLSSFKYYKQAIHLLLRNKELQRYAYIPVILNLFIYILVIVLSIKLLNDWTVKAPDILTSSEWLQWTQPAWNFLLKMIQWTLIIPLLFIASYFTFIISYLVISSPFNDILSERTEWIKTGKQNSPTSLFQNIKMLVPSLGFTFKILIKQLIWTGIAIPFLLVPGIGFLPLFFVTAYFTGLGFLDIPFSRNGFEIKIKNKKFAELKNQIFSIGIIAEISLLIPGLALFVFPLGVIAGTLLFIEHEK